MFIFFITISHYYTSLFTLILNITMIIMFVLVGGILPLFERKFLSLTQRRVGPKYVGYKGRLQFLADALKVLWKDFIQLNTTNNLFLFGLPILYLNINLIFFINIIWVNNLTALNFEYNFIFYILLELLIHIVIFITGLTLKNKYTIIASNRLLNICFTLEIYVLIINTLFLVILKSFSFQKILILKQNIILIFFLSLLIPSILIYFLISTAKTPFDIVEAETEIIMGYHVEYSGFLFGLFVLSEYFHVLMSIYIIGFLVF